jgi:Tfp pilus assembly protein FimT
MQKLKILQKGVSIIEIVVSIFIIVIFTMILIADFPKIQRQFALSKASYKFAEDIGKARSLGFSGAFTTNSGNIITSVNSYGIYLDISADNKKYIIYANRNIDLKYDKYSQSCDDPLLNQNTKDCIIDSVDLNKISSSLSFLNINGNNSTNININFAPPNPDVEIYVGGTAIEPGSVNIVLGLNADNNPSRTIIVNTSGLISL